MRTRSPSTVPLASRKQHLAWVALASLTLGAISPATLARPLFESEVVLPVILELPADDLLRHARKKPTVDGQLRYRDADGEDVVLDVAITTRGKSRLEQCRYPPLSLSFRKKQTASTLFAGQKKLKLVTPCRGGGNYKRYLNQEYTIYGAYNLLTDHSFRVRMLEVTFRDANGKRSEQVHRAFLIESIKEVASRVGKIALKPRLIDVPQLDLGQLSVLMLFQFMIGNTDFSPRKGPPADGCCHNGKVVGAPGSTDGWIVVPYDFDQSGIINASYAAPDERLKIRSVRERVYRGYCSINSELDATIALFNQRRGAIERLFGNAAEKASANKTALRYLSAFYDTINDPARRQKKILGVCLGQATIARDDR